MKKYYISLDLIKSEKWRQFLESAAAALQINLVLFCVGAEEQYSAGNRCPICGHELEALSATTETMLICTTGARDTKTQRPEVFCLDGVYSVAVRHYPCCHMRNAVEFDERTGLAKELLTAVYNIRCNLADEAKLSAQLTALHHTNRMVLSVSLGDQQALERVMNLLLSAAIILCDAEGSWLHYEAEEQRRVLTKGNCILTSDITAFNGNNTVTSEIYSPVMHAAFGIVPSVDSVRVNDILDFMVNECVSLYETLKLLKSMESTLAVILDAVDNMALLVDRKLRICYANKAASEILNQPIRELITRSILEIDAPWRQCFTPAADTVTKGIKDIITCGSRNRQIDWEVYTLGRGTDMTGWFVLARDRTDFYHFRELGRKSDNLVQTSTMIHVIAHEVRNPLATIKGLLQIIDLKSTAPDISKYVNIGMKEIAKLTLMLDDFSRLGKASAISLEETADSDVVIVTNDDLIRFSSEGVFKAENIKFYSIGKCESIRSTIEKYKPRIIFVDDNYLNIHILHKSLTRIAADYPDTKILIAGDKIHIEISHAFYIRKPLNYTKLTETVKSI